MFEVAGLSNRRFCVCVSRHISKLDTCDWHEAYCEIVNTAQEGMVARYGATLAVSKKFACSFHNG